MVVAVDGLRGCGGWRCAQRWGLMVCAAVERGQSDISPPHSSAMQSPSLLKDLFCGCNTACRLLMKMHFFLLREVKNQRLSGFVGW